MKYLFIAPLLALALVSCGKPAAESEPATVETHAEENIVTLSRENLQHIEFKIEPVVWGSLGMTLKAAGRISPDLNKTAKVTPTLEGRVTKLNFDLNDDVKTGDVLALVESPEMLGKLLEVKAPIDGVIVDRSVTVGEFVEKGRELCTISDPTQLWAIAEVKERDFAAIKLGQDATFTVLAYPQEKFKGKVVLIGNQVESPSRTVEVRILVDNAAKPLKPGMFADVEITTTVMENVLLVSDSALQTEGDAQIMFVALGDNRFEKRIVHLGEEQGGRVQVLQGVKAGENVVTDGSFILKSELLKGGLGEE